MLIFKNLLKNPINNLLLLTSRVNTYITRYTLTYIRTNFTQAKMSTVEGTAATYTTPGSDFANVLKPTNFKIDFDAVKPSQLVLKALASPINPADLSQIVGGYNEPKRFTDLGTTPNDPVSVGGNEGVFKVVHVGSDAGSEFKVGDHVIPLLPSFGTWRSYATAEPKDLIKVNGISVDQASTISINPSTAYQILNQYVTDWDTKGGNDWIVQNSGNSQVSKFVIQLAKALYNVNVISVIRDGKPQEVTDELIKLGAKHVINESEFTKEDFDITKYTNGGNVRLALNGSSDPTVPSLVKSLSKNGTLVSFGVVGGTKIEYDARLQLFKNLSTRSFWLTANTYANPDLKKDTVEKLVEIYKTGKISDVPYNKVSYKAGQDLAKLVVDAIAESKKSGKQVIFYE